MSELIHCKTCGAEISSSARFCPHCGEPDFLPKEYITERKRMEEIQRQKRLKETLLQKGPRIHIYSHELYGRGGGYDLVQYIDIDKKDISHYVDSYQPGDWENHYYIRLLPGNHCMSLKGDKKGVTLSFHIDENSSIIIFNYKYVDSIFSNSYFTLCNITVN